MALFDVAVMYVNWHMPDACSEAEIIVFLWIPYIKYIFIINNNLVYVQKFFRPIKKLWFKHLKNKENIWMINVQGSVRVIYDHNN